MSMPANSKIPIGLQYKPVSKWPCNRQATLLVAPHEGHGIPVTILNKQGVALDSRKCGFQTVAYARYPYPASRNSAEMLYSFTLFNALINKEKVEFFADSFRGLNPES